MPLSRMYNKLRLVGLKKIMLEEKTIKCNVFWVALLHKRKEKTSITLVNHLIFLELCKYQYNIYTNTLLGLWHREALA